MKEPGVILSWLVLAAALLLLLLWALGILPGGAAGPSEPPRPTAVEEALPEPPEPALPEAPAEPEVVEPDPENALR